MTKLNEKAFNKICKEIDKLAISRRRKAMGISKGIFNMSPDEELSVTVFFKDAEPKYFYQVSTVEINDEWLKVYYFNELEKLKSIANFKIDNPNFIGYIANAPEFDEVER